MYEAIKNFAKQFVFDPVVKNAEKLVRADGFVVAGMGGSNLAPGLLKIWKPELNVVSHRDYGLPNSSYEVWEKTLMIASSYSGNTEETLDSFGEALQRNLPVAAVSVGGKLLDLAKKEGMPYIQLPDAGIQPRSALGLSIKALLKLMGEEQGLNEVSMLATSLDSLSLEEAGKELVNRLAGHVPVIYASSRNFPIAYNWKIKFNETGKIPAFCNVFPELNHNEMTGFDVIESTRKLAQNFYIILLKDPADDPRIISRMEILAKLYQDRGLPVVEVSLEGSTAFHKIFSSLVLADWAAYYIAQYYGAESEQVPMVEEFKALIASPEAR